MSKNLLTAFRWYSLLLAIACPEASNSSEVFKSRSKDLLSRFLVIPIAVVEANRNRFAKLIAVAIRLSWAIISYAIPSSRASSQSITRAEKASSFAFCSPTILGKV